MVLTHERFQIHAQIDKLQKNVQTTSGELTRLKDSADALEHVIKAKNAETRYKPPTPRSYFVFSD